MVFMFSRRPSFRSFSTATSSMTLAATFQTAVLRKNVTAPMNDRRSSLLRIRAETFERTLERNPRVRLSFVEFAEKRQISENVRFIHQVRQWKKSFDSMDAASRAVCCRSIVQEFIVEDAESQINISYTLQKAVLTELESSKEIPKSIFDDVTKEVWGMLQYDGWATFVKSGECDEVQVMAGTPRAAPVEATS
jgi:hypothetical protein